MSAHRNATAAAMPIRPITISASGSSGANRRHAITSEYITSAPIALAAMNAQFIARNIKTRFIKQILHGVADDIAFH